MCDVISPTIALMISAGMAAAGTAVSVNAANKQANVQARNLSIQYQSEQNALALQMQQEGEAAAEAMNERTLAARNEMASFDAIAAEYGGGVSVEREAAGMAFSRDHDLASIQRNRGNALIQLGQESRGSQARTNAQLASISRPSRLGAALTIGGQLASGYASTQRPQTSSTPKASS